MEPTAVLFITVFSTLIFTCVTAACYLIYEKLKIDDTSLESTDESTNLLHYTLI